MPTDPLPLIVQQALRPQNFFVTQENRLRIDFVADEVVPWETFGGHLLEAALSRSQQQFCSWHVYLDAERRTAVPLISVRWQKEGESLHVTRQVLVHGHEAYEDTPGVILTRPVQKWTTELVGTIDGERLRPERLDRDAIAHELQTLVLLAVIGTSRLPITSLESPLPAYSLGQLGYLPDGAGEASPKNEPLAFLSAALTGQHSLLVRAKALETALRVQPAVAPAELGRAIQQAAVHPDRGPRWAAELLRTVFNTVALSPYTGFADALVALVDALAAASWFGPDESLRLLSYMLRHLCRHLTAFDLALFHSFGANYPDALFLDLLLKAYLRQIERQPDSLAGPQARLLRRALRQACLLRQTYEGHRVPDAPTSMGENARVLPAPFVRMPEEQILERGKRRRQLYDGESTQSLLKDHARGVLAVAVDELDDPRELRELGLAHYLDRPLGMLHGPGEVDRTPLLAYEAYSRQIARGRLAALKSAGWIDPPRREALQSAIDVLSQPGVAVRDLTPGERPGVVSIADARKAAPDFVLLRTTRGSLDELLASYDLSALRAVSPPLADWLLHDPSVLVVQQFAGETPSPPVLQAYAHGVLQLELGFPRAEPESVYRQHLAVELPVRLQLLRIATEGVLQDVSERKLWLELRPL